MAKAEERIKTIQDRYSSYVRTHSKRNKKNEGTSPIATRACATSMGGVIKECRPNLELDELDVSRAPSAIDSMNKDPMKRLVAEGRKKMDQRINTTPVKSRKGS